ncbi:MAG TPA: hypothetical protein VMV69_21995 [Pirellulales bacterium]|nr:hypothetical protein [Pirellulales bacterium]
MFQGDSGAFVKLAFALAVLLGAWFALADEPPPAKDVEPGESRDAARAEARDANLLPNGDFESGDESPAAWQPIDGLSSFWVDDDDPEHGKVVKFDTDVLQSQAYKWWERIVAGAKAGDAPAKLPTVEPKYDTLAGLDGVWFYSDYIPVEKNKAYWLTLDVKGPEIMVWLVGYPEKPDTTFGADQGALRQFLEESKGTAEPQKRGRRAFIHKYIWKGQMKAGGLNEWKTYSRRAKPFEPTKNTPSVRYVRVLVYPYWPPGVYYVDNVKLVELKPPNAGAAP